MIVDALVLPPMMLGITEASTTRSSRSPRIRNSASENRRAILTRSCSMLDAC